MKQSVGVAVVLALTALTSAGRAQVSGGALAPAANDPVPAPAKHGWLSVGDPAPELKIAHWVKGDKIEKFEPGKAYMVEFWATWCGPCIANIPRLSRLQRMYKDKGLTVIGVSSSDKQGVEDVRPFVEKQGDRMNYTVAVDDGYETGGSYMAATRQSGIPVVYIIDRGGKLAWFGHPDAGAADVVKHVLAGDFNMDAFNKQVASVQQHAENVKKALELKDYDAALAELLTVKKELPDHSADAEMGRVVVLYGYKMDKPQAVSLASGLYESEFKDDFERLTNMAEMFANDAQAPASARDLALKFAQRATEIGKEDPATALTVLSDVYKSISEIDKAIEAQEKAVAASPDNARKGMEAKLDQLKALRANKAKGVAPLPNH